MEDCCFESKNEMRCGDKTLISAVSFTIVVYTLHDAKMHSALELHSPVTRGEQLPVQGELNIYGHSPVRES